MWCLGYIPVCTLKPGTLQTGECVPCLLGTALTGHGAEVTDCLLLCRNQGSDFNDRWLDRISCYWFNFLQVKAALQYVIKVSAAACVLCTNHIDTRPKRVLGSNSVCTFSFCRYLQEAAEAKQLEQCGPRVRWPRSAMVLISDLPSSLICWRINEDPSCAEILVSAEGLCWMGVYVSCS